MKISIQTPDFRASDKLTGFVEESVGKLSVFTDRIQEAQVLLKREKSGKQKDKICELKLVIPGNDIFASRQSETFEGAVSETLKAAQQQVRRWREGMDAKNMRGSSLPPLEEEAPIEEE